MHCGKTKKSKHFAPFIRQIFTATTSLLKKVRPLCSHRCFADRKSKGDDCKRGMKSKALQVDEQDCANRIVEILIEYF